MDNFCRVGKVEARIRRFVKILKVAKVDHWHIKAEILTSVTLTPY
ncbi:hypothetical protein [Marinobacter sp. ANT_B65]|nr:hypothetical protein [Marinobacter sp. ANT_B65]